MHVRWMAPELRTAMDHHQGDIVPKIDGRAAGQNRLGGLLTIGATLLTVGWISFLAWALTRGAAALLQLLYAAAH